MNWLTPWWSDFGAFVQMGKHGAYVWPAFGVCALALAGEWCALKKQAARVRGAAGVDAPLLLPLGEGMDGGHAATWATGLPPPQPSPSGGGGMPRPPSVDAGGGHPQ